jgi:hypothetical protein
MIHYKPRGVPQRVRTCWRLSRRRAWKQCCNFSVSVCHRPAEFVAGPAVQEHGLLLAAIACSGSSLTRVSEHGVSVLLLGSC